MRKQTLAAALGAALSLLAIAPVASAGQAAFSHAYRCQSEATGAKTHPLIFHCNARTPGGVAPAAPADCDPATQSWGSMQAHCKAANAAEQPGPAGG